MNLLKRLLKAGLLAFMLLTVFSAQANTIKSIRSFHNNVKTRIVADLSSKPDYATSLSANKAVFSLRIRSVSNAAKAPGKLVVNSRSCVKGFKKQLDGKDVRYVFSLNKCKDVKAFTLAPSKDSKNYRLVVDFGTPDNVATTTAANASKSTVKTVSNPSTPAIDIKVPLKNYERDLFIKYSQTSKDGFRTMSPSNAKLYQSKLEQLRKDYAKAQQQSKKVQVASGTKSSAKVSAAKKEEVEDIVSEASAPPVPVRVTSVSKPFIIAVDAGHGGKDPGAIGKRGVKEKNVTLAISRALYNYINSNKSFRGTLTRSSDVFIDLDKRSEIARRRKADLLISIHADSVASGSSTARGASVLVLSENRALRENDNILRKNKQTQLIGGAGEVMDQSVGNPYLATAILDMSSTNSRSEGNLLAKEILNQLSAFTHVRKNAPISASLAVLKSPDIPSLLIETGYLSNRYEEIQLNQPNYQKQIAYRIYLGIKSYYEKYPAQKLKSRQESYARTNSLKGKRSVVVKKGDSLSLIAKKNGVSVSSLRQLNSLKSDSLRVGQVIYLP